MASILIGCFQTGSGASGYNRDVLKHRRAFALPADGRKGKSPISRAIATRTGDGTLRGKRMA